MTEMYESSSFQKTHKPSKTVDSCDAVAIQKASICIAAKIKPFASVGNVDVRCCDKLTVAQSTIPCKGVKNGECNFLIAQKITVEIPIEYGADVILSDPFVECDCPFGEGCDCDR